VTSAQVRNRSTFWQARWPCLRGVGGASLRRHHEEGGEANAVCGGAICAKVSTELRRGSVQLRG
jgi:hypothetical protein